MEKCVDNIQNFPTVIENVRINRDLGQFLFCPLVYRWKSEARSLIAS